MLAPLMADDEVERIKALHASHLLESLPEESFDRVTRLAARLINVPIALVSLVDSDRQWFKSKQGLDANETPRDISFCGHAILQDDVFVVNDTHEDERFFDNPLVTSEPKIRFYAGCPLRLESGFKIGTLCIIDRKPRQLTESEHETLVELAKIIEDQVISIHKATTDSLTGLQNRRGFFHLAQQVIEIKSLQQNQAAILIFDLNHFKKINDNFGHQVGDSALIEFAKILINSFRRSDLVCRLGGDEFIVLIHNLKSTTINKFLKKINQQTQTLNESEKYPFKLSYAVGFREFTPKSNMKIEDMVYDADIMMYENKKTK